MSSFRAALRFCSGASIAFPCAAFCASYSICIVVFVALSMLDWFLGLVPVLGIFLLLPISSMSCWGHFLVSLVLLLCVILPIPLFLLRFRFSV